MVAERLSAVPSCHGKKEHTSRLFVPPLLWDCLVLFLMDKITCVWHVWFARWRFYPEHRWCVVDLFTGSTWKCLTAVEIPEDLFAAFLFFFLVEKRRIWNVLPVACFILSFRNLTYLFGPAIEMWLGELPQTDGQFWKEQMDEAKMVGLPPDGCGIFVQMGTRI